MKSQRERDADLIIVASVEEYGMRHHMPVKEVLPLFEKHNIFALLRSQYDVLHMMDLSEGADVAESILQGADI